MNTHDEIRALARTQGLADDVVDSLLDDLSPHLDAYTELVLTVDGLEVITGGRGPRVAAALARLAARHGASTATVSTFRALQARWPLVMLGLKLELGPRASSPTLYLRTKDAVDVVLDALHDHVEIPDGLRACLDGSRVLYGLGFHDEDGVPQVKTYTLGAVEVEGRSEPGFVSWRLRAGRLSQEVKRYVPEVPWREITGDGDRWARLLDTGRELGFLKAGHVAITEVDGRATELKLYIERVGAVPTDWSAR